MQFLIALASLLAAAQAISVASPKAGTTLVPGQKVVVQLTEPISTSAEAGMEEVSLVVGIVPCIFNGCPPASTDLGEILFIGQYKSQGQLGNTLNTFQNFTFTVPTDISGSASIQVQHNFLTTLPGNIAEPGVEYATLAVTIGGSGSGSGGGSTGQTVVIHPKATGNSAKCMDVKGAVYANGTPVDIFDCNGTPAQKWQFTSGGALVSINPADQSQWCLDAGVQADWANGVKMKIWQCFAGLVQQTWTPVSGTAGTIHLPSGNFCLDLTDGNQTNFNPLQIWTCATGNNNQAWIAA